MPLPFDATLKTLAQSGPRRFLGAFEDLPPGPVNLLNVDLSTVTKSTDLVFGIGDPLREVTIFDCQASADADKHFLLLPYHALVYERLRVPVHSIILLLRPEAQHPSLTGTVSYQPRPGRGKMDFSYEIIRLWERPAELLLANGLETVPLAPLGRLPVGVPTAEGMAWVIQQVIERILRDADPEQGKKLLTAAYVLTGLRISLRTSLQMSQGVRAMRESVTYMAILEEGEAKGEVKGARRILLRQARERFGSPDSATQMALDAITDLERLDRMSLRVLRAADWQELLQTP